MSSYLRNPSFLNSFFLKDEAGYDMMALTFYFSFHFPDGYRLKVRDSAAKVCADYWSLCGNSLRWMITPLTSRWQDIPDGYTMELWLAAYPDKDWVWSMIFHSGRIKSEAATYQIVGLGNSTQTHDYSNLMFFVPVTWFAENPGHDPIGLYQRWAQMLQARHGTAGVGLVPPEDTPKRGRTSATAAALGRQFPGIELPDYINNLNARSGLLSPNWLNLIDAEYLAQLGGYDAIKGALAKERLGEVVGVHPYEGGVILSSGDAPALRETEQSTQPPLTYGPVARLLKPLRTPEPWGSWGCPMDESLNWLARFD